MYDKFVCLFIYLIFNGTMYLSAMHVRAGLWKGRSTYLTCSMMCLLTVCVLLLVCCASSSKRKAHFSVKESVGKLLVSEVRFRTLCESILGEML